MQALSVTQMDGTVGGGSGVGPGTLAFENGVCSVGGFFIGLGISAFFPEAKIAQGAVSAFTSGASIKICPGLVTQYNKILTSPNYVPNVYVGQNDLSPSIDTSGLGDLQTIPNFDITPDSGGDVGFADAGWGGGGSICEFNDLVCAV